MRLPVYLVAASLLALTAPSPSGIAPTAIAAAPKPGTVSGQVTLKKGRREISDRSKVVVYVENVPGDAVEPTAGKHSVGQKNKQFTPRTTVVTKGTSVDFPNDDKVFHNVFSVSRAARFDLGLYRAGSTKSVEFKRPGVVDVYCNIHPEMAAKVLVLDTSYFAETKADGKFQIGGLPPGTYTVKAWHAQAREFEGSVTIEPGGTTDLNIELEQTTGVDAHLRKDGTPYGRYQ